jgi:trehalose-6-phosphate synthase
VTFFGPSLKALWKKTHYFMQYGLAAHNANYFINVTNKVFVNRVTSLWLQGDFIYGET